MEKELYWGFILICCPGKKKMSYFINYPYSSLLVKFVRRLAKSFNWFIGIFAKKYGSFSPKLGGEKNSKSASGYLKKEKKNFQAAPLAISDIVFIFRILIVLFI